MLRPSWAAKSNGPYSDSCIRKLSSEFKETLLIISVCRIRPYRNTQCSNAVRLVSTCDLCAADGLCFMQLWKEPLGGLTFIRIKQAIYV